MHTTYMCLSETKQRQVLISTHTVKKIVILYPRAQALSPHPAEVVSENS